MQSCYVVRLPILSEEERATLQQIAPSGMPDGIVTQIVGADAEGVCVVTLWDTDESETSSPST